MKVEQTLIKMRKRIEDPKHWTQGALAVDSTGMYTHSKDKHAVKWCVLGARDRVIPARTKGIEDLENTIVELLDDVAGSIFFDNVWIADKGNKRKLLRSGRGTVDVNDDVGHKAILLVLDVAIEQAHARGI